MQEIYHRDALMALLDKQVELDANDLAHTEHPLTTAVHRAQDRIWLEPLLAQLEAS